MSDDGDAVWYLTGETIDGSPLKPFVVRDVKACGSVEAGAMIVECECGCVRQHDRPHAYVGLDLKGWVCGQCRIFNGEEKEMQSECRSCGIVRPF